MSKSVLATTVALHVLEAIREKHPALIADNMPASWGMNRLRKELANQAADQQPDAAIESGRTDEEIAPTARDLYVAGVIFEACKRAVEKGRSLDGLNIDAIALRAVQEYHDKA